MHLNNFGSTKYTSDIGVNASLDINVWNLPPQKGMLLDFLRDIIKTYQEVLLDSARIWLLHENDEDALLDFISKNLDVNFYPPDLALLARRGVRSRGRRYARRPGHVVPRLNSRMTPSMWMDSEMAKSIDARGNIMPQARRRQVLRRLRGSEHGGDDDACPSCVLLLQAQRRRRSGLPGRPLLRHPAGAVRQTEGVREEWNRWLCCTVSNNRYGSELYFQVSSIVFVVFHMQIFTTLHKGKLEDSPIPPKSSAP